MPPIAGLTRIEPVHLDRLEKEGVFTTGILLEVSETPTRRQSLADHVGASTNDVLTWRDEALMLNLAAFGPTEHILLIQAGFPGLESILSVDIETFRARILRAATELKIDPPSQLTSVGWWDQARTLETLPERDTEPAGDVGAGFLRFVIGVVVGGLGAALAAGFAPADPPLLGVLVVGTILLATGVVGRVAAEGLGGFIGLLTGSTFVLLILLGRSVLIAIPDSPLWQNQGIAFVLGPGAGLPALIVGWLAAFVARRTRRGRASQVAGGTA